MTMQSSVLDSLKHSAQATRSILEEYSRTTDGGIFSRFPNGSCRDSSYLLLKHLKDTDVPGVRLTSATSDASLDFHTHAWLEIDGVIVDITADQFNYRLQEQMPPVFISADRTWHDRYFPEQTPE